MPVKRARKLPAPAPKRLDTSTLTVRMPGGMKRKLGLQVIEDGYGMRGKSRWVTEAVFGFLKDKSWRTQVLDGEMGVGAHNEEKDVYIIPSALTTNLVDALAALRFRVQEEVAAGTYPKHLAPEVSVASIVRGAVTWRLYPELRMNPVEPQAEMFPEEGG